MKQAVIYFNI